MDEHALRVLEFEKVLDLAAREAGFSVGRERVLAMRPADSYEDALIQQRLTAEMTLLYQQGLEVSVGGAIDIRPHIHAAAIGQVLEPADLGECARTLSAAFRAHRLLERLRDRAPHLAAIGDRIADFRRFEDAVEVAVTPRGEVADAASEALATTRRELRAAQDRLDQRAQAALADAIRRGIAQEGLLTERNGRKVLPIKAETRGQIQGIVHDVSSSGATVFVEPLSVVEAGNQVRELQLAEQREVRRVLQRLTAMVGEREAEALESLGALADLDMLNARVRFGRRVGAQLPPPGEVATWLRPTGATVVVRARHPLLRGDVVPTDIDVLGDGTGVLITGPNTGGKTVALKTLGLLTLMAQAGLPLPCEDSSVVRVYERVFADIGDEQSIEQSLSTFSSHMRNVSGILEQARPSTLVLLDELGAGTDPVEGSALARAILEELLSRGCTVVATTHHGELKAFANNDPRLRNASVEFDLETLSPTYHLTIGLPGQSNAIAIARRLGLDPSVLERASAQLSPEHFELERLLGEIREERAASAEAHAREEDARREAEELRLALARRRDEVEQERVGILREAQRDAESTLARFNREVDQWRRRAATRSFDPQAAEETLRRLDADLSRLKSTAKPRRTPTVTALQPPGSIPVVPGVRLHVRDIPQEGEALSELGEDGRVDVQFGALRMKVSIDRIERIDPPASPQPARAQPTRQSAPIVRPGTGMEIDLRGLRAEEALLRFESYLDDAFRAGFPFIRIIHGKGTGALRAAIREALTGHPLVRSFESAAQNEGGDGVTIAVLAG